MIRPFPSRRRALVLSFSFFLLVLALAGLALAQMPSPAPPPLEPPGTGGVATVDRALARLSTSKRLLVIAAHPDDEDTSLISLVARGMGGEAAYLSLSRGEGGQNLIGPELGPGLGLIRSRELLAARGVDGGRQFFTRAYDFGFTRSLDETLKLWPKDILVEDVVRVIRRFKPQVIVSIFPGVPSPTHGQHQAAGVTAHAAFPLAGDASALPQLQEEGLLPWTPQVLYRSTWFDEKATTLTLPTSGVDPLTGKSAFQVAMASRSMHRSQDMGQLQELGPQQTRLAWVQGGAGKDAKDLFEGVDTRLAAMVATVPDDGRRREAEQYLSEAQRLAEATRATLNPAHLNAAVPRLAEILKRLRSARAVLDGQARPEERPAAELIDEKIRIAEDGLAAAAGIAVDATTEREALIAGETFPVKAVVWNSGGGEAPKATVTLVPAPEWGGSETSGAAKDLAAGALGSWEIQETVPAAAPPTVPYFLRRPLQGSLYDWTGAAPAVKGEPFGPAPLVARFDLTVAGVPVSLEREVVHLHEDQALGEVRRPLRIVPEVEVAVADDLLVWPTARKEPRRLQVTLTSHAPARVSGRLETAIEGSSHWPAVPAQTFALDPGEETTLEVPLEPPAGLAPGSSRVHLAAVLDGAAGGRFDLATPVIDYPHIRPTPRPRPADVPVSAVDVKLPALKRVGYIRGASDRVPEFLRQVGVPLELLGPQDLLEGDLGRYDVIVVGSRAYETDPALVQANHRLLDYARNGGVVIVQYQQYPYITGKFAPFPLDIARPHDRVTDETAAAKVLDPSSPVFHTPNEIGPADWEGWVQERGLYFAHTWDAAYQPLLSMADPGGPDLQGGLLVAKVGKGRYVYTGLAFFRQLPAGVPGGYRLFANLLALRGDGGAGKKK
jgi:LmbE family N-acetylglucosaminyl deacetylase